MRELHVANRPHIKNGHFVSRLRALPNCIPGNFFFEELNRFYSLLILHKKARLMHFESDRLFSINLIRGLSRDPPKALHTLISSLLKKKIFKFAANGWKIRK